MPKLESGFGSDPKSSQMKCLATSLTILILANTGCTQNQYAAAKQDCANSGGQFIAYGSRGYGCFINDVSGQPTKAHNILHQKQDFLKPPLADILNAQAGDTPEALLPTDTPRSDLPYQNTNSETDTVPNDTGTIGLHQPKVLIEQITPRPNQFQYPPPPPPPPSLDADSE